MTDSHDIRHLLNCTNCGWHTVVEGPMRNADYEKETHETSIRNALSIGPYCPRDSVAWVTLDDQVVL